MESSLFGADQPTVPDEEALIERVRADDQLAWTLLVRKHQDAVFRLSYLIVGNAADARDVSQDVFLRAFRQFHKFDSKQRFRPWILKITARLSSNHRRSVKRYMRMLFGWSRSEVSADAIELPDEKKVIMESIRRIPEAQRNVIYLRYFLGLKEAEIADTLGLAKGTVKSRSTRALDKLNTLVSNELANMALKKTDE